MGSRAKNFRRRGGDDEDDDGGNAGFDNGAGGSKTKDKDMLAKPKKPQPPKTSKLLSFAEDEEDDHSPTTSARRSKSDRDKQKSVSRLGKTGSSAHKITSSRDRIPSSVSAPSIPSNVQPQAGEYTIEKLRELQKNTRTLASSKSSETKSSVEPVVVLKGLIKPVGSQPPIVPQEEEEADDNSMRVDPDFQKDEEETEFRFSSMGIGLKKDSSDSSIPDRATINAIRAKRERLRQARAAPDYISLDARGGALSDDEGDFHGRIALLGDKADDKGAKGVFESFDEGPVVEVSNKLNGQLGMDGDEDEDEDEKWEEEQFRKGLGKRMDDVSKSNGVPVSGPIEPPNVPVHGVVYPSSVYSSASSSPVPVVGVSRSVEVMSIHQQAEVAMRALQENFERVKGTHGRTLSSINATNMKLTESLKNIDDFEKFLSDAKEKYKFMYDLRDYVHVLCQFLQDKAPYIEELEEEMQKLHEDRASATVERRLAFNKDELTEVEVAVNAAKSVLNKGNSGAAAAMAAQAALASVREPSNLPCQLDEFGRDLNLKRRNDLAIKAEMRKHRQARVETKKRHAFANGNNQSIEGELSSDESDSETDAYKSRWNELVLTAEQVFSNADDRYAKLSLVKERFSNWKKHDLRGYSDAYMSLSAPAIFSPFVRLELLKWDPLYDDADFYNMQWHSLLFDYGLPTNQSDFHPDDTDANLVPELVEKVALPILHHDIAHCWDMLSTRRTRNAVSATDLIINYVPTTSQALQDLLAAIRARLSDAVSNLDVPTWDTLVTKAVPDAARIAAYRFGMSIRLLRNICQWKDILALPVLEQLALDELLSGKILPHVRNITSNIHDAVTRTERIVASLSGVWSGPSIGERSSKLQPLVEYVMLLGKTLEKKQMMGGSGEDEIYGLARRLKKMLVDLNEYDKARSILKTFHLKEAL